MPDLCQLSFSVRFISNMQSLTNGYIVTQQNATVLVDPGFLEGGVRCVEEGFALLILSHLS